MEGKWRGIRYSQSAFQFFDFDRRGPFGQGKHQIPLAFPPAEPSGPVLTREPDVSATKTSHLDDFQ